MSKQENDLWAGVSSAGAFSDISAEILSAASDVSIIIDPSGIVGGIVTNPDSSTLGCLDHWVGRNLRSFLTEESIPKFDRRLNDIVGKSAGRKRTAELNHSDNAEWEFPVRYTFLSSASNDQIIMVGRDLRPVAEVQQQLVAVQLALEKDYEAFRDFDTRYRVAMNASNSAIAFVDGHSGRIEDINPAGARLLGADASALIGSTFAHEFENRKQTEFVNQLTSVASSDNSVPMDVRTARGKVPILLAPSAFRVSGRTVLVCALEPVQKSLPMAELGGALMSLYRSGVDAMVFTDKRGVLVDCNDSFLDMCDVANAASFKGQSFADYLVRGSVDLKVLADNAIRAGRMRSYSTKLVTSFGAQIPVDISVTFFDDLAEPRLGYVIRDASRSDAVRDGNASLATDAAQDVIDLVGASPLKDIVAATTDVIEKMCIETAVELTRNNRVAVADMLGLSRQSLYVKLRKYGLLNKKDE